MRRLRAASLIEAVVAAALFMIVFAVTLELLPALTVGRGDGLDTVRVRNALESARRRYARGHGPRGVLPSR